jgi:putative holliday junction resolvase
VPHALEVVEITTALREELRRKRIGAVDYGTKRVGFAVADELHITTSPRGTFANTPQLLEELQSAILLERLGCVLVGVPVQHDGSVSPLMRTIEVFGEKLRAATSLPLYYVDEAYSSREATQSMIAAGRKKRDRSRKGSADEVAAAVILREFLRELDGV